MISHLCGVIKDVLLKVGKLYIPMDFVVLEMEEHQEIPIILGRPLLATASALINARKGRITLKVREEVVESIIFNALKYPSSTAQCYRVDLANESKSNLTLPPTSKQVPTHESEPLPLNLNTKQCYGEHNLPPSSDLDFEVGQHVTHSSSHLNL
ncbi:PREDICTED: uncharacterized protein LOC108663046 [Theobroma cacao]|uniref:Uncharacterized protein LOC108663046 n=1 Tax=Theobroma cacao TaxID=3641 RepID=A0AB32WN02_THECC|nr:PREDICTED: uncharacterized protein LOC108663046 [Theobroma cacao]